jgi:uncharacterized repeat protein (TIGR01451 family)
VTDAVAAATPGTSVSYTLVAANAGPDPVVGATVADTFPATLSCNWTCNGANGGSCTSSGTGSINDTIDLPAGATASYTAVCAIASLATGALSNTATISLNGGTVDPNPLNNSATDLTTLVPVADLQITVSDAVSVSVPGGSTSYVIAASNLGPSDTAAIVADAFPPTLACSWTCAGVNGGVCTAAGAGDIHDPVVLPSGASVSYTAACSISAAATGTLVNTATVTGVASDPSPGNNSATDSNTLLTLPDLSIDDIRLAEGNSGTTNFVFHVSLSAPALAGGVRFDLATSDGSALAPADYLASTQIGQLIPEGQSSVSVTVGVVGDAVVEPNEEFVVNLSNIRGAHLIDGQATGTILDEDTATRILSSAPNPSAVGQSYTVAVEVSGGVASPAGTVTISDGSNSCGPVALMAGSAPGSSASCALTSTMAGARTLTASYAPNSAAFAASSASASHQVNPAGTAIRVSGPSRSRINMPTAFGFELTVVAPGGGIPVGAVTLSSGSSSCQVTVPAASSCDLSFNLLGPRTVSASFTSSDGNHQASASSGSGDLQTLIYAQSDLAVSKTDTVDHYAEGELLVYTVQLRNSGPDQAANLRLRDQAPAGLVDVRWSCDASGGAACPASIGSGDLDAQVPSFPVGALLNYSFFGNVAGYPQQILNTAALQLPADSTIEDLVPANNSASDLNVRNLLLADGFEAVTVHAADGQYVLPSSALRTVLDATARAVYTLVDAHGPAARVYARIFNDQLQYALAQRDSNGRLRLGPWRSYPGEPQLRWTATAQAQGWVLQALSLE